MAPLGGTAVQDHVALAEIELCGELIIAASAAEERLSLESIDEVLRVAEEREAGTGRKTPGACRQPPGPVSPTHPGSRPDR
ncbi:hypothetical protein TNCT6_32250 [Streptomyces sp. 6-11-2]|nr:hypothetical protein TNCT6_32250 [Streptomyces sp. 6-11-2]